MKSKQQKIADKIDNLGIDLKASIDELRKQNDEALYQVANKMYSSVFAGTPTMLMQLTMEQNFVLIRQNEEIIRMLKGIYIKL